MAQKKKQENGEIKKNDNILLDSHGEIGDIKKDLEKYIDDKINEVFVEELDKANKKIIREKTRKLFVKNIVIIILLAIIGFLIYLLYSNNYFDRFFNKESNIKDVETINQKDQNDIVQDKKEEQIDDKEKDSEKAPTLDELKKEYGYLLDNYYINENSLYLKDFYDGKLTDNLKNYWTLDSLDFTSLRKEEDYQVISRSTFKIAYEKLFSDNFNAGSFDYLGNKIRYLNEMESFITTNFLEKKESNIKREITDIKLSDDKIIITTVEGIINDHKLFNILEKDEIEDYKDDSLVNYAESLNKMIYIFKDNKLIDIEK